MFIHRMLQYMAWSLFGNLKINFFLIFIFLIKMAP